MKFSVVAKLSIIGIQLDVAGFRYAMFTELSAVKPAPSSVMMPDGGPDVGERLSVGVTTEQVNAKFT